jgi:hypothetical protein
MFPVALSEALIAAIGGVTSLLAGLLAAWISGKRKGDADKLDIAMLEVLNQASAFRVNADKSPAASPAGASELLFLTEKEKVTKPLVEGVTKLVTEYHQQGLTQATVQFWFSVVAASIGFAWILYAGLQFKADAPATALKSIPGFVIDGVAALFFQQASATRERATDLYDRLRKDKQTDEALRLVDAIADDRTRSAVRAQLVLHLAGLTPNALNLEFFLPSNDGKTGRVPAREARDINPSL